MKYLKLFENIYKDYTSGDHIQNIEDILLEFIDDKMFLLYVYPYLTPKPIGSISSNIIKGKGSYGWESQTRSKRLKKLKRPNTNRTFKVKITLSDDMVIDQILKTEEEKALFTTGIFYSMSRIYQYNKRIVDRLRELKNDVTNRLERFGYSFYKDVDICDITKSATFAVTYKSHKTKPVIHKKIFENIYYHEVDHDNDLTSLNILIGTMLKFDDNELLQIHDIIKSISNDFFVEEHGAVKNIYSYSDEWLSYINIGITKSVDEWYYLYNRKSRVAYKCDQFDGLLECLNDILKSLTPSILESNKPDTNQYYQEISFDEYYIKAHKELVNSWTGPDNPIFNYFPESEISIIQNLLNNSTHLVSTDISLDSLGRLLISDFFSEKVGLLILRLDDEWYFTHDKKTNLFYKCDQFDGLLRFLKDIGI